MQTDTTTITDGQRAADELADLQADIERCEREHRAALAKRESATTPKEHAAARDAAEWAAECLRRAKERHAARHQELSPELQAKTIVETSNRLLAAQQAFREYSAQLGLHRADSVLHLTPSSDTNASAPGAAD